MNIILDCLLDESPEFISTTRARTHSTGINLNAIEHKTITMKRQIYSNTLLLRLSQVYQTKEWTQSRVRPIIHHQTNSNEYSINERPNHRQSNLFHRKSLFGICFFLCSVENSVNRKNTTIKTSPSIPIYGAKLLLLRTKTQIWTITSFQSEFDRWT